MNETSNPEYAKAIRDLWRLQNLGRDWDGYNAEDTSRESLDLADAIIKTVYFKYGLLPYDISPIPTGGLMLIYSVVGGSREHERLEVDIGYGWKGGKFNGDMTDISLLLSKPTGRKDKSGRPEQRYKEVHSTSLAQVFSYIEMIQVIRENLDEISS